MKNNFSKRFRNMPRVAQRALKIRLTLSGQILLTLAIAGFFVFGGLGEARADAPAGLTPLQYDWSGRIITQTLTADKSPYYIDFSRIQDSGETLTIEPGVVIKFGPWYMEGFYYYPIILYFNGNVEIHGTEDNPVVFTSIYDDGYGGDSNADGGATAPAAGDWGGFQIASRFIMEHAIIRHGGADARGLMTFYSNSGNRLSDSVISRNSRGINFGVGYSDDPMIIENNDFSYAGQGSAINVHSTANPVIRQNDIHNNQTGIAIFDQAAPLINNNNIYNNSNYGAEVDVYYTPDQPVNARGNWWGSAKGPSHSANPDGDGDRVTDKIDYGDWRFSVYDPANPDPDPERDPVILVPGIMGSVLKEDNILIDNEIWPDPLTYLADPIDEQLKKLEMDSFGFSKENIFPADAIRSVFGINFYGGLIEYLEASGYEEGKNLFIFPYDWRLDLNIIAGEDEDVPEVVTLKEKIDEVISQSGSDKLNIIAHSMGGLIVKAYAQKYGQERINKFIDIATPHLGAPKAAKILNYGDDLDIGIFINDIGIGILNESKIKNISQNMPSIYQLLPSAPYFSLPGEEYGHYLFNDSNLGINLPKGELGYNESMQYLIGTGEDGRNYFVNKNSLLHSAIDNVEIDNSYNIAGCGKATIGKIGDLGKKKFFWDKYKIEYIDGDGTVPLRSADYYGGDKRYYSRGQEHSKILSADGVKEFIESILSGNEAGFDFSQYGNFKQDDSICGISGKVVEYHCPVEMHIYDNQGNHAGPLENGDIEMNIPGVQYDIVGDNKFAYLPEGGSYTITGTATTTGVLEVEVSEVKNNKYINTAYFSDINFDSASTRIEFSLADNLDDQLIEVDKDGDGIYEDSFAPDSLLTEEERKDLTKPNTNISLTGTEGKNGYYVSDVGIELTAEDENSGVLKTEYSLDNGQSWVEYQSRFLLVEDGEYKIIYSSTDRAGNREAEKEALIRVDKLAPEILILIPEEISHSEKLNIEYLIDDNISGAATNTIAIYLDDKLMTVAAIDLFYEKLGRHEIKIIAEDLAGNKAEETRSISVITDIGGTISDVNRANDEKMVNEKARRELIKDLKKIEDYIKKYGRREEKRDKRQKELMDKCMKKKGKSWCESRLGKAFVKVNYGLSKIHDKIVEARYKLILKELELYRKKNWVTETGYDIIREDLRYLIAKL